MPYRAKKFYNPALVCHQCTVSSIELLDTARFSVAMGISIKSGPLDVGQPHDEGHGWKTVRHLI